MEGTPVDTTIAEKINIDIAFQGKTPAVGYFTSQDEVEQAVNAYLKGIYPFCDEGSTASLSGIKYLTISKIEDAFVRPLESTEYTYTLVEADYKETLEQDYANVSASKAMELMEQFLAAKATDFASYNTVTLTYNVYKVGDVSWQFAKTDGVWKSLNLFSATYYYTLEKDDYKTTMGMSYTNFDNLGDIAHYCPIFLAHKYPYAKDGDTISLTYQWSESVDGQRVYTDKESFWRLEGGVWAAYDPYATELVEVEEKTAQCSYDGSNWIVDRLVGNIVTIELTKSEYEAIYNWVIAEKGIEWKDSRYDNSEYYCGASFHYENINNVFDSTWKPYYNVNNYLDGMTNDEIQVLAEQRLAEALMAAVLPVVVPMPNSRMVYNVVYLLYNNAKAKVKTQMSFKYNGSDWECMGRPISIQ